MGDTLLRILSAALILVGVAGTCAAGAARDTVCPGGHRARSLDRRLHTHRLGQRGRRHHADGAGGADLGLDYAAGLLGARRAGASRQAFIGAVLGTVAGIFMGLVGVLFMPLVGAAVGEYLAQKDHQRAVKVGVATWLGIMAGLVAKVVIAFMMIGIFVAVLLI